MSFTVQEEKVLKHMLSGLTNSQIAKELNISVHTVKMYLEQLYKTLNVQNRVQAVIKYLKILIKSNNTKELRRILDTIP